MVTRRAQNTRKKLLEAAELLVIRDGVSRLTLEAVASEAGMSKGSLLYHFPTKDDLIRGMVVRLIERFEEDVEASRDEGPGGWVRGYARATFGWAEEPREVAVDAALLATMANNPKLLDPLRERYEVWQRRIEDDGLDPLVGTLLRLAADGVWLTALFGLAPSDGELKEGVLRALIELTQDSP